MVNEVFSGNGHDTDTEVLEQARKIAEGHQHEDGISGNLSPQNLSLLRQMLTPPEEYREQAVFLICDFLDENEAYDNVAAFYEARDLGMSTDFNIAYMFALAASNRRNRKNNRIASLLDALQHVKYTTNSMPKDGKSGKSSTPVG